MRRNNRYKDCRNASPLFNRRSRCRRVVVPIIPEEKWGTTRSLDKKGNVLKPRRVKQPESFKHDMIMLAVM